MKSFFPIRLFAVIGISALVVIGCEKISSFFEPKPDKPNAIQERAMNQPKIVGPNDLLDVNDMPAITPMTDEQRQYFVSIVDAVLRVIQKKSTLEQEEALFGEGHYRWPKDPKKPIKVSKSYRADNFRIRFLTLGFSRENQNSIWSRGGLTIEPKNGVYAMDFPESFFADFVLIKTFAEDRPNQSIKRVNVFQFRSKETSPTVQLQFEAREDVSSLEDKYPKSFHLFKLTRMGE